MTLSPFSATWRTDVARFLNRLIAGPDDLAWIETGSGTPTFTFATPGNLSVGYTTQTMETVRIGSLLTFSLQMTFTPTFSTSSGAAQVAGFPFTFAGGVASVAFGAAQSKPTYPTGATGPAALAASGGQHLILNTQGSGVSSNLMPANFTSGNTYILFAAGALSLQ